MIIHGYDSESKSLFSWNGDFVFKGRVDAPPEGADIVPKDYRKQYEMLGCYFLSALRRDAVIYRFDGDNISHMIGTTLGEGYAVSAVATDVAYGLVKARMYPVLMCGPDCRNPKKVSAFCRRFPVSTVYVCPLVDELAAFGLLVSKLIGKEKSRRAPLCQPNIETGVSVIEEFDSKLDGDGMGRMADYLNRGTPIVNDMMKCVGISPFYGKVLLKNGEDSFMVRSGAIDRYFPSEPISLKKYAATSVPVEVRNTPEFEKDTGCSSEVVVISASSDYIPDLPVFMNFYHLMSGKEFVATANPSNFDKTVPVFAYNSVCK